VATIVIVGVVYINRPPRPGETPGVAKGRPAPAFSGSTLDGAALTLAGLRGRPVIVNFWGPSCVPCRDEFPLFIDELATHKADDIAIVGVLMFDPPAPARDFVAAYHATWPTIDDPDGTIRAAYRAIARPQTYFIDREGVLQGIQVGQLTAADFERLYTAIAGPAAAGSGSP
jgi:cytochrome c biogenesis protein CcmG/thiol:disulfide interchange protein DsbE